jgi:sugar phosphate isomerase/epimerase
MKPCVTISLLSEARGGPFVFWDDLRSSARAAAELGFAAIEIFPPSANSVDHAELQEVLASNSLNLAAVGTGGGWVKHKLTLTSADPVIRERAREFISEMISFAAPFGAAVIIGSLQGRSDAEVPREKALDYLGDSLRQLASRAAAHNVPPFTNI